MPLSAVDAISPAFARMQQQLFTPFRLSQWIRLAIVGFLAGEMGGGGGSLLRIPLNIPSSRSSQQFQGPLGGGISAPLILGIVLAGILSFVLLLVLAYIGSRMRFVLFDSVVHGECRIREFWNRRGEPAFRYFIFQILFGLAAIMSIAVLIGMPLLIAFLVGWIRNPGEHIAGLVLGGSVLLLVFVSLIIVLALVQVLAKDFVVPMMALDNLTVSEAWSRLRSMMEANKGSYAGYIGMKILLALGAAIITGIAGFIVFIVLLIPVGGVGLIGILGGRAVGLTWNPVTIAIAIVAGALALLFLFLVGSLISVPVIVFLPAYAIYFFADRYAPLHALMYPPTETPGNGLVSP